MTLAVPSASAPCSQPPAEHDRHRADGGLPEQGPAERSPTEQGHTEPGHTEPRHSADQGAGRRRGRGGTSGAGVTARANAAHSATVGGDAVRDNTVRGTAPSSTAVRGVPADGRARVLPTAVALCLSVFLALTGCGTLDDTGSPTGTGGTAGAGGRGQVVTVGTAVATLQSVPVHPATTSPPYRRDEFGSAWSDVDNNGCDTRNDILHRDLTLVTVGRNLCIVLTGELRDPYTNRIVRFDRSRSASAIQIDHVVALADAWRTGAAFWSPDKRLAFANDPENLLAVNGPTNQEKSDDDAARWLPPNRGYRCRYVARQIGVKARYGLWMEMAEREAMIKILSGCPEQPVLGAARTR